MTFHVSVHCFQNTLFRRCAFTTAANRAKSRTRAPRMSGGSDAARTAGKAASAGAGDTESEDSDFMAPRRNGKRAHQGDAVRPPKRARHGDAGGYAGVRAREWCREGSYGGWEAASSALLGMSRAAMEGGALLAGITTEARHQITYGYRCPFFNTHQCKWECRIVVPRAGNATQAKLRPNEAWRASEHADHECTVMVDRRYQHVNHAGEQRTGAHQMFVLAAQNNPKMYDWNRQQVQRFFTHDRHIEVLDGQLKEAVTRCLRHKQHAVKKAACEKMGVPEACGERAKLLVLCEHLEFQHVVCQADFSVNTPYLVPGSRVRTSRDDDATAPNLVLMLTTLNLILNVARACDLSGGLGAVAGVDHTHKMAREKKAPHLTFNVIAPDASAKHAAFGPVCDETESTTAYALKIVLEHARQAAAFARHVDMPV